MEGPKTRSRRSNGNSVGLHQCEDEILPVISKRDTAKGEARHNVERYDTGMLSPNVHQSTDDGFQTATADGLDGPLNSSCNNVPDTRQENPRFIPIAVCGMACRLPGGISSPPELWDFLMAKRDARTRVPPTRFNIDAYHTTNPKPGTTVAEHGYFLDETNDLGALDTSFFSMPKVEVERFDPQQRLLLEASREALEDAGETNWRGRNIGVYVGSFAQDWYDLTFSEPQPYGVYQVSGTHDFALSNRISYEMDLRGPSVTVRTACSAGLTGLNEACLAIARGDCESAIVCGSNLVMSPSTILAESEQGVLNPEASCNTFSDHANGYARGEAIVAIFVKALGTAERDRSPVRAVITGAAVNCDGKTHGITQPSSDAQEALIRRAYDVAGLSNFSRTAFVECHGTGTKVGDPVELEAVGRVFGKRTTPTYISSVKANLGHSEGASGLTSLLKAVFALEKRTIPPQIKAWPLNPKIPFAEKGLVVPNDPMPWPAGCDERVSINCFGVGGSNAHIVVESAATHKEAPEDDSQRSAAEQDAPQLLLFSANSVESLKRMTHQYQEFLERPDISLPDVAYTLAMRRENLPFRSFSVASRVKPGAPSVPSAGRTDQKPYLVMVFTGQGAQWPQMGRQLIQSNPFFRATIQSLDRYLEGILGADGPGWKIEAELLRPPRTSRVNEAEFSQPLCTAVQIALVDSFAAIGIRPAAVVGHSSGEIAAAYASGALTARDAIAVAFLRGAAVALQTRKGSMAAVGLSWDDAARYLVPGAVLACDNSPRSVTISGDVQPLQEVSASIKNAQPGVPVTVLKVEKAYHSHHMVEVGANYYQAMVDCNITAAPPSKLFFSTVSGRLFQPGKDGFDALGPEYWRKNLECPVLFRGALQNLLQHHASMNPVFLEIGPHSALAGPVRQTLTEALSQAPYITALTRRSNSEEDFLCAVGRLYTLHLDMDLTSLVKGGSCVTDLPRYPWDHSRNYWHETRVTKERRLRQHAYHSLLGVKVAESTDLEPIWRNLFHLDNAPWVRDHKVNGTIIFPFAGFVSMASEAIRQVTGVQDGVKLRQVAVTTALLVSEGSPLELVTSFHRHHLTNTTESQWWEFAVSSHNGHTWTKHCTGQVTSGDDSLHVPCQDPSLDLPRRLDSAKAYEASRRVGLDYGPSFRVFDRASTSTTSPHRGAAFVQNRWHDADCNYHLHPIVLDAFFQLLAITAVDGLAHEGRRFVPTRVGSITMTRSVADGFVFMTNADDEEGGIAGSGNVLDDASRTSVVTFSDVHLEHLSADDKEQEEEVQTTARSEWVPHVDFRPIHTLFEPLHEPITSDVELALDRMVDIATEISLRSLEGTTPYTSHMELYRQMLMQTNSGSLASQEESTLRNQMSSIAQSILGSPEAPVAEAVRRVCENIKCIASGDVAPSDILGPDDVLETINELLHGLDCSPFLRTLAHSKPNLRVLELDASGRATAGYLRQLRREDGQALFSSYVSTSSSSQNVARSQDQFKGTTNFEATPLNIDQDPSSQGFKDRQFDLVIAPQVYRSPKLERSLVHILKLLSPDGRLLLYSPRPGLKWSRYVLGTQAWWWCGVKDDRPDEPSPTEERWAALLRVAGFQSPVDVVPSSSEHRFFGNVIVARPRLYSSPMKQVSLIAGDEHRQSHFASLLEASGFTTSSCSSLERAPEGQDAMILLDEGSSFFAGMDSRRFNWLKAMVEAASHTRIGIFWVTKESSVCCSQPEYGSVLGFARALRQEKSVDFAVCEVDDVNESADLILDAFTKFHHRQREANAGMGPDLEYSIHDRVVRVNRIFPFRMDAEGTSTQQNEEAVLRVGRAGRLDTLHWRVMPAAPSPQAKQVEIEVHATGLNFRDVLLAMGLLQAPQSSFGLEIAGIVRRVGTAVTSVCVGDRVLSTSIQGFSTVDIVSEDTCERLPDELSFRDGVSMPVVFTTAIYCLVDIGNLKAGQTVLIHSGAGGVGLAAIQVAQMIGAEVYTTVSTENKVNYLMETFGIPRDRIFNSRTASFADDLLRETEGRGADLVLNSLGGELLHTTWRRCVARWGTMVEIGKRDLIEMGKLDMDVFLANRSYRCVDMYQMGIERPDITKRLLAVTMDYFRRGMIKPIRVAEVTKAVDVIQSFRGLQLGQHIGKVVVEMRDSEGCLQVGELTRVPHKRAIRLDRNGSYLIVGGLGGLGRAVSVWLAQNGARHLAFLSRNAGCGAHDQEFAREIESMGCSVQLIRGSVVEQNDVKQAIGNMQSHAPLKGIIQMSMVLRDQSFQEMTLEDWDSARDPKVRGTWNLHDASITSGLKLDFFLLFSSTSGVLGQPGQANYASANSFLDAFVQYRNGMGLPCTAIDLGAVEDAGYLTSNQDLLRKMKGMGWRPVREVELLAALECALSSSHPTGSNTDGIVVDKNRFLLGITPTIPLSSPDSSVRLRQDIRLSVYHNNQKTGPSRGTKTKDSALADFLAHARADPATVLRQGADQAAARLAFEIGERLLGLLLRSGEEVVISKSLLELGLDSLVAIELRSWWKVAFGFDITVLEMLGMGTLEALGRKAVTGLRALYEC